MSNTAALGYQTYIGEYISGSGSKPGWSLTITNDGLKVSDLFKTFRELRWSEIEEIEVLDAGTIWALGTVIMVHTTNGEEFAYKIARCDSLQVYLTVKMYRGGNGADDLAEQRKKHRQERKSNS